MIAQAVVLVGGQGTRLGDRTRNRPKPLLEVGGRPFLGWVVDELRRHGVREILLLAGFRGEQVVEALGTAPDVRILVESVPLGTGGALRWAAADLDSRFFFLNGDSLFDINLWDLAALAPEAEATLALRRVENASRYGRVITDRDLIVDFAARSDAPGPGLINGGVGVLSKRIVDRIAPGGAVSIEQDIYPKMAADGVLFGRAYDGVFIDIGIPEDFERAQTFVPDRLKRGAVIFDRDGVLNIDIGYAHRQDQIVWVEGAIDAVKAVNDAGLLAFVATNQAGVAHGHYEEQHVLALHQWMAEEMSRRGAHIDAFVYSPYHPEAIVEAYRRTSDCRKPGPGMINDLLSRFRVDRSRTLMVGDRETDIAAAEAAGVEGVLFEGGNLETLVRARLGRLQR